MSYERCGFKSSQQSRTRAESSQAIRAAGYRRVGSDGVPTGSQSRKGGREDRTTGTKPSQKRRAATGPLAAARGARRETRMIASFSVEAISAPRGEGRRP